MTLPDRLLDQPQSYLKSGGTNAFSSASRESSVERIKRGRKKKRSSFSRRMREIVRAKVYRELLVEEDDGDPRYHLSSACLPAKQPANAIQFA